MQLYNNGGYQNPNFVSIDLNNDGLLDMLIMERSPYKLESYIARNTTGPHGALFDYEPKYAEEIVRLNGYMLVRDMNCDGVEDLIDRGMGGVRIHYGYYDGGLQWKVRSMHEPKFYNPTTGFSNLMYVAPNGDIPLLSDIDQDGDIDVLAFDVFMPGIVFYKNVQVEFNLNCKRDSFQVSSWCYGNLSRTDSFWYNNYLCKTDGIGKTEHSTLVCMQNLDMNNDGKLDILSGSSLSSSINLIYNTGTNLFPHYGNQDTLWGPSSQPFFLNTYMCPFMVDYDKDGKRDMIIGPNDLSGINRKQVYSMQNTGNQQFSYDTSSFISRLGMDEGVRSRPVFSDYDGDGDLDLFVAVDSSSSRYGSEPSHIVYYENKGNDSMPNYERIDPDFLGLSSFGFHSLHIAFGDLDNDTVSDVLVGHSDGMAYAINKASSNQTIPNYTPVDTVFAALDYARINNPTRPFKYITPLLFDVDKDGKEDIICGEKYGNLLYFHNSGTAGAMSFDYKIYFLGNIDVSGDQDPLYSPFSSWEGYSVPWISAVDGSDSLYLHVGNMDGQIISYQMDTDAYAIFPLWDTLLHAGYAGVNFSAPSMGKIHGDSSVVMALGNQYGGLYFMEHPIATTDSTDGLWITSRHPNTIRVYPNPNDGKFRIRWPKNPRIPVHLEIYSSLGEKLAHQVLRQAEEQISVDLPAGQVYLLRAFSADHKEVFVSQFVIE